MEFTNIISSIVGSSRSSKTSSQGEVDRLSKDLDISESEAREILSQ